MGVDQVVGIICFLLTLRVLVISAWFAMHGLSLPVHNALGLDHIGVYAMVFTIRFALRYRRHSSDVVRKRQNLVCGGEQIVHSV